MLTKRKTVIDTSHIRKIISKMLSMLFLWILTSIKTEEMPIAGHVVSSLNLRWVLVLSQVYQLRKVWDSQFNSKTHYSTFVFYTNSVTFKKVNLYKLKVPTNTSLFNYNHSNSMKQKKISNIKICINITNCFTFCILIEIKTLVAV